LRRRIASQILQEWWALLAKIAARLLKIFSLLRRRMPQVSKSDHVCAFCSLVIQIGYENLTPEDISKINMHMRIAHGLRRFEISR